MWAAFNDPLMDCKACKARHRADKLIEDCAAHGEKSADGWTNEKMEAYIARARHSLPGVRQQGFHRHPQVQPDVQDLPGRDRGQRIARSICAPRPRRASSSTSKTSMRTTRRKAARSASAQIGKSFRNEITPGNFTFRTREFEQMELEFFCKPGRRIWNGSHYWRGFCRDWLLNLGMKEENLRLRDHEPEELAFYSKATTDIEYLFPFGWGELWGVADRTDYDLKQHQEHSGESMEYFDPGDQRALYPLCASSLRWARTASRWPSCATPTTRKSCEERRHPRGAAPASGAGAVQGGRAAAFQEQAGRQGARSVSACSPNTSWWITTKPAPSASATAGRTRSGTPLCITVDFDTLEDRQRHRARPRYHAARTSSPSKTSPLISSRRSISKTNWARRRDFVLRRALRVLTKSRKNEALIRNDGMYVISGIFSRANACKKVKARRAEVASTRSAQARNTAQAKRRGARRPPPVAETGRSKPNEAGRATSELASAVERPC